MRAAYRVLGILISVMVVIQAAAIAFGLFGLWKDVEDGASVEKNYEGNGGFAVHSGGAMVIAVLALLLLIISFFTHVAGASKAAGAVVGLVVLQFVLGITAYSLPAIGVLHAVNAFAIAAVAGIAGSRYSGRSAAPRATAVPA